MNRRSPLAWVEVAIVFAALLACYLPGISSVLLHPDESGWIASSIVFERLVCADIFSPVWANTYTNRAAPPGTRYWIGLGRRLGGYDESSLKSTLNKSWDFRKDFQANFQAGAAPGERLLYWSRLPMAVLAVVAISAFFIILRDGFGRVAAYAFVILSAISPYLLTNLRRAMNEAPLLALLAIAIVATGYALKIARVQGPGAGRKSQWALAILGLVIGLAALTKLNSFGLLAPAMVVAIIAARSQPPARHKALYYASRILLPVGVSLLVFVLFNPFLYKNPPGRIVSMFHTRSVTMDQQVLDYPAQTINGPARRLRVVPMRVFQDHAPLHFAGAIFVNAPLCLIGLVVIGFRAWRRLFRNSGDSMAAALFVTALAMAWPPLFTPLDWQRYHLLPVIFATLFGAIGAGWLVSRAASLVGSRMSAPRQTSS